MKNLRMVVAVLSVMTFCGPVMAQGIENGDSLFSAYIGVGTALEKSNLEVDGQNFSWGNIGAEMGLSYLYFPTAYLGLGVDFSIAGFQGSDTLDYVPGRFFYHTLETDFETGLVKLMAAGRVNVNPSSPVRLYLPFGAGAVVSNSNITYRWDEQFERKEESLDASFGWYAGVGLEFAWTENSAWAIEARYNMFRCDDSELGWQPGVRSLGGDSTRSYVSLGITVSFK